MRRGSLVPVNLINDYGDWRPSLHYQSAGHPPQDGRDGCPRVGRAHDLAHYRDTARPGALARCGILRGDAAKRHNRTRHTGDDARETFETECRTIAGLACRQEDRADGDVISSRPQQHGGLVCGMRRGADEGTRQPRARRLGAAPARQMHPVGARRRGRLDILVRRHGRPEAMSKGYQSSEQREPFFGRQIFLAQAEPAAAAREHRLGDVFERLARLMAIRDDEQRRDRKRHPRSQLGMRRAEQQLGLDRHPDRCFARLGDRCRHRRRGKARYWAALGLGVADMQIAIAEHGKRHPQLVRSG